MEHRSFNPDRKASFIHRPNRFIVIAQSGEELIRAHCPNPGRLREILLPGRELILEKSDNPDRKTLWTLAAAKYGSAVIPLISVRANALVGDLIIPKLYPGYAAFSERLLGKSRIDWFLEKGQSKKWIEVKACTLVEKGRAMFPDAPSTRAVKHLKELISLGSGCTGHVVFTVMNPSAQVFSPNPHTDPNLCLTLGKAADSGVGITAVTIRTDETGWSSVDNYNLPVDLKTSELAVRDSGVLVGVWESSEIKKPHFITIDHHKEYLSKAEHKKAKLPEGQNGTYRLMVSFPIRGDISCFNSIVSELMEMSDSCASGVCSWIGNPAIDPMFLDWILDYRHRRVFNS